MAMEELNIKAKNNHELLNTSAFIDRVFTVLTELGLNLNYGDFVSKCYKNGIIKVLKSLNLYQTTGRGNNKKVLVDERILFIINTTATTDNKLYATSLIDLVNGRVNMSLFQDKEPTKEYNELEIGAETRQLGNFATYIFFNPITGLYKIGMSKNVQNRFFQLKREVSEKLQAIAVCHENKESEIHFKYKNKRVFGEWFSIDLNDVLDIITDYGFKNYS